MSVALGRLTFSRPSNLCNDFNYFVIFSEPKKNKTKTHIHGFAAFSLKSIFFFIFPSKSFFITYLNLKLLFYNNIVVFEPGAGGASRIELIALINGVFFFLTNMIDRYLIIVLKLTNNNRNAKNVIKSLRVPCFVYINRFNFTNLSKIRAYKRP